MARHVRALFAKAALWVRPSLQWTGGYLFELWKGSGEMDDLRRTRDVTIVTHNGKLFGGHYRQQLMPTVAQLTTCMQFGEGMHGGETAPAHLALRTGENLIVERGRCSVTLFSDIKRRLRRYGDK